ncbi:unnamed protein product [Brassica rapa]|uniref:Uncharacterized protein n=3 Tax=Brassica TaxID=3705 RepID=A0A8D9GSC9_BRACM|nr:unnamed protein product [Brassica napus]CAG7885609.1 unnamed protein product [Brassica rapa]
MVKEEESKGESPWRLGFHLDHPASLPYFLQKTTFKGRVFMTHATKAIYKLLLTDYVKVSKVSVEDIFIGPTNLIYTISQSTMHHRSPKRVWPFIKPTFYP